MCFAVGVQTNNTASNRKSSLATGIRPAVLQQSGQSKHAARVEELLADRQGVLPIWIRAPKGGAEHYTGFSRSKLYDLAAKRAIRSVSVREPGRASGTRLFNLASILAYIESAVTAEAEVEAEK